jgi:hypothetical protein
MTSSDSTDHFEQARRLLAASERWATLSDLEVEEALALNLIALAIDHEQVSERKLTPFLVYALDRLAVEARLRLVICTGDIMERAARDNQRCVGAPAFLPLICMDTSPEVVSTAALTAAQLLPSKHDDPLWGPRQLLEVAAKPGFEGFRRAAVLAALTQMGDARVYALVWESWKASDHETQHELLGYIGGQPATVAAFDFLLNVAESCSADERYFGHVAGVMRRLIRTAYGPKTGGYGNGTALMMSAPALGCARSF